MGAALAFGLPENGKKERSDNDVRRQKHGTYRGALCALLAAARGEVYAANIYVDSSVDADGDGQSWATAKKMFQKVVVTSSPRREEV